MTEPSAPIAGFQRAEQVFRSVLAKVGRTQLGRPTPDDAWDVRNLVSHVIYGHRWAVDVLERGAGEWPTAGDVIGESEPMDVYVESVDALLAAFNKPGAFDKRVMMPMGEQPAAFLLTICEGQLLEHAWDLARATGQSTDLAPELYQQALEGVRQGLPDEARGDFYARARPAPPNSTAADRMAAFLGRQV